jgi:hypothetical protein
MLRKSAKGITLIEAVGTIVLMIPIMMACIMAVQEVSQAYAIKQGLAQAARQAAADLAVAYEQSHLVAQSRALQDSLVFSKIAVRNAVTSATQFDDGQFDTAADPPSVTVTVHYRANAITNLPAFPAIDPINLGSSLDLNASATYSLQPD